MYPVRAIAGCGCFEGLVEAGLVLALLVVDAEYQRISIVWFHKGLQLSYSVGWHHDGEHYAHEKSYGAA